MSIACYHPLTAIVSPNQKSINGKKVLKIVNPMYLTDYKARTGKEVPDECIMRLPCGQCQGCRVQRSREWANRCMMELQYHDSAYFVTLTYDDAHAPRSFYPDPETGEAMESLTLKPRDFTLFMKRLRRAFPNDEIRFFMSGEYGSKTFRPHYHVILYGLHLDDLRFYKFNELRQPLYNSKKLSKIWSDPETHEPYGFVVIGEVNWETCAYTARYVLKKLTGEAAKFYTDFNIEPQFNRMSRKPGIAAKFFEEHTDIYKYDFINLPTSKGGIKFRPPRYFDKLYDVDHHEELESLKATRQKMAAEAQKLKLEKTSLSLDELLLVEERAYAKKIKTLRRPLE